MELSTGSSSSKNLQSRQLCYCGLAVKIFKSKTERNPNRRFYGCELYKDGGTEHCKFFKWLDPKSVTAAESEIREREEMVNGLTTTISELRSLLQKSEGDCEVLKLKIEEMDNVIYRQRVIIAGLSGLVICSIGAIALGSKN